MLSKVATHRTLGKANDRSLKGSLLGFKKNMQGTPRLYDTSTSQHRNGVGFQTDSLKAYTVTVPAWRT